MAKSKAVDPVAWARATKRRSGGTACAVCSTPEAVRAIKAWLPLWRSGEIGVSLAQAADYLNANTGWKGKVGSFRRCLKDHHGFSPCG